MALAVPLITVSSWVRVPPGSFEMRNMKKWTLRNFWDGTTAIFVKSGCYSIDSDDLGIIIDRELNELEDTKKQWLELKKLREEYNEQSED